jgi:hypothetical protein
MILLKSKGNQIKKRGDLKMKIKITIENKDKIEDALKMVNGKSYAHSYTSFNEMLGVVEEANKRTSSLGLKKSVLKGCQFISTSGKETAKSYKYSRLATKVTIERGASEWFLVAIAKTTVYPSGGNSTLFLTKKQHDWLLLDQQKKYSVI